MNLRLKIPQDYKSSGTTWYFKENKNASYSVEDVNHDGKKDLKVKATAGYKYISSQLSLSTVSGEHYRLEFDVVSSNIPAMKAYAVACNPVGGSLDWLQTISCGTPGHYVFDFVGKESLNDRMRIKWESDIEENYIPEVVFSNIRISKIGDPFNLGKKPQGQTITQQVIGDKRYELANHLGNVLNVVTDRKLPVDIPLTANSPQGDGIVDYFTADVVSYSDYLPFGQVMPSRHGDDNQYRYGFNGKEKIDEVSGEGNSLDFGARLYNPRIGRWMSPDSWEKKYPSWSTYNFVFNNPLCYNDPTGNGPEWKPVVKDYGIVLLREEGDNATTLANFLDVKKEVADVLWNSRCEDGSVELTENVPGIKNISGAIVDYKQNPDNYDGILDKNYDCHESSLALLTNTWINKNNIINGKALSDELKNGVYEDVTKNPSQFIFGRTLIRFGNSAGNTEHSATYLGTSKNGTIYTWSKNGNGDKPAIYTVDQLKNIYNAKPQGLGEEKGGGFYNMGGTTNPYEEQKKSETIKKDEQNKD